MNVFVANIIKNKLADLPYFDKKAGLVQTITKEDATSGDKVSLLRYPVKVDVSEESSMDPMIPDENIKGMFYLEDGGMRNEGGNDWVSELTLVCWICPKKISKDVNAVSINALADISSRLKPFINEEPISRLKINIVSIPVRDASIFSKYTYRETDTQYLMPPYDFFALKLKCSFRLNGACLTPLKEPEEC